MNNFEFYSPTCFVFGKENENKVGEYVQRFGGSKVLIHYGGGSVVRSGLLDRVKASLDKESIPYIELGGVKPNPRSGAILTISTLPSTFATSSSDTTSRTTPCLKS